MLENTFYSQEQHGPFEYFELGDFLLESGELLNNAKLAYAVHGKLNAAKDNAILMTIMFSGTSKHMAHYIGESLALDPNKYCIILPNQLGNGLSSSPHNSDFPSLLKGAGNESCFACHERADFFRAKSDGNANTAKSANTGINGLK